MYMNFRRCKPSLKSVVGRLWISHAVQEIVKKTWKLSLFLYLQYFFTLLRFQTQHKTLLIFKKNVIPTKSHSANSSFMKPQSLVHFNFLKVLKFWLYTHFLLFQNKLKTVLHIKLKVYNLLMICTPNVYIFLFQLMTGKWTGVVRWRSLLTDMAKTTSTF